MIGNAIPETVKPVPVSVAPLIVTGAAPVEIKVRDCGGAAVFTKTLPKATLPALMLSAGDTASSCKLNVSDAPFTVAVSVVA